MSKTIAILAVSGLAAAASGQSVWGVNNLADSNFGTGGDTLIQYDFSNPGSFSGPGPILTRADNGNTLPGMAGLDFDGNFADPTLYMSDGYGNNPGEIFTVDTDTAVATSVGTVSGSGGMNDLAWDPNTGDLYGVDNSNNLWSNVDEPANAVNEGPLSIDGGLNVGLAFDSEGNIHVHDLQSDTIYSGSGATTSVSSLHTIPFDTNFSQGLFIDWSRDDAGYHAALNNTALTSESWHFDSMADGGGTYGPSALGSFQDLGGLPAAEIGDLTRPVPAPGSLALLGLGGLAAARRRR